MSENLTEEQKEALLKLLKAFLERTVEVDNLIMNLSYFLRDNFDFFDFNAHYEPPLMLSEKEFSALTKDLAEDFDVIEISNSAKRFFIDLVRFSPENKKRVIIAFSVRNINGITVYVIENVTAKTYISH